MDGGRYRDGGTSSREAAGGLPILVLAPVDRTAWRDAHAGTTALEERAGILSRVAGEAAGTRALTSLELAWYGGRGRDATVHVTVRVGEEAPADAGARTRTARGDAATARIRGALDDHSSVRWAPVPLGRHRRLDAGTARDHVARLYIRAAAAPGQPLEVYPIRPATIERALRRTRGSTVVRVRVLALPRRRGVPLRRVTSSHDYGRLVPAGASDRSGAGGDPLRSDAAEMWQFLVRVQVESSREIPHDLLAAIAADVRGTGAGSIGVVLRGEAAAVDAEWGLRATRRADADAWPSDTVVLNLREAACLIPFPDASGADVHATDRSSRISRRLPRAGLLLGTVSGTRRAVAIPWADTLRHLFVIGATGSGKSTALLNAALQAIRAPRQQAVVVLDPHGSLVEALAGRLTPDEQERVVWFDPSDPLAPMTWNPLAGGDRTTIDTIIAWAWEQFDPYRTMQAGMGPIAEQTLRAVLATVMTRAGATLADAFALIQDDAKATEYLRGVTDEAVRGFWRMRATMTEQQRNEYSYYLTSKLSPFAHDPILRGVVGRDSTLDIPGVLRDGKILLVSIRKAVVGAETTTMLVRLLKRFLWREITARGAGGDDQLPVQLLIDEFIGYQQPVLDATMLQSGRKFHTSLILATQNLAAIDDSLREAIAANAASMLAYRVGIYDAGAVAAMLGDQALAADLTTLPNFRAVARVAAEGEPMTPVLVDASKPPKGFSTERLEQVRDASRARHGSPSEPPAPVESAALTPPTEGGQSTLDAPRGRAPVRASGGAAPSRAPRRGSTSRVSRSAAPSRTPAPVARARVADDPARDISDRLIALPATAEAVADALRAAGMAVEVDDEQDVRIHGVLPAPVYVLAEDRDLRFFTGFRYRARSSRAARLELANEINDRLRIVRATASTSGEARLEFDWYPQLGPVTSAAAIVAAVRRFGSAVGSALALDEERRKILLAR